MSRTDPKGKMPPDAVYVTKALRAAVSKAIKDHARTGHPIYVWKKGKVVRIPASQLRRRK